MQRIVNLTDAVEERKEKIKELEYELEMKAQNLTKSEQDLIAAKQQMKRNVENAEANAMMIDHKEKKIDALTKQVSKFHVLYVSVSNFGMYNYVELIKQ